MYQCYDEINLVVLYNHNVYEDTESDFWWKIKHYAKQWY